MGISEQLSIFGNEYWDFKNTTQSEIHKIAKYPAIMVAPMQNQLLQSLKAEFPHYISMLDPFHGSGVTLIEAASLGFKVYGIDINPYAHLIAKVKLYGVDNDTLMHSNAIITNTITDLQTSNNYQLHSFYNINKWFREDIIKDLSIIRHAISLEKDLRTRLYYWLCFGEIVKKYSNTRTSTFKLHIKLEDKIMELPNQVFDDFFLKIDTAYKYLTNDNLNFTIVCGNAITHMGSLPNNSFDIVCTSPPYGDNNTTVTYGQYSALQLFWINIDDLKCDNSFLSSYSKIDSISMGGTHCNEITGKYHSFDDFLTKITDTKKRKTIRFVSDYEKAIIEMYRLLKPGGSMVLTLGNRRVDNTEFPLVEITKELGAELQMTLLYSLNRKILNKRMPIRVSKIQNHGAVNSMSKETVLIFQK